MMIKSRNFKNKTLLVSGAIIGLLLAAVICAPALAPYNPLAICLDTAKLPPGGGHLFGTDTLGRDILSRVLWGGRVSLLIGVAATLVSLGVGLVIGLMAGYFGGKIDVAFTVIMDLFLAFPSLLLAIGISVIIPPGLLATVIALGAVGWASFARLFRGLALSFRENVFIDASRAIGCSHLRIIAVHILPQCSPLALIAASLKVGGFILAESALSFLGLGVQPPDPTWGSMVSQYRNYLPSAPWMVIFPGGAIALTVLAFNLFGDALRDRLDPKLKL